MHSVQAKSGVYGSSGSTIKIMQDYLGTTFRQNAPDDVWLAGAGHPDLVGQYTADATVFLNTIIQDGNWQTNQRLY